MVIPCYSAIFLLGIVLADSCSVDLNGKIHLWFFLIITLGFGVIIHMNISGWKRCISSFDY